MINKHYFNCILYQLEIIEYKPYYNHNIISQKININKYITIITNYIYIYIF